MVDRNNSRAGGASTMDEPQISRGDLDEIRALFGVIAPETEIVMDDVDSFDDVLVGVDDEDEAKKILHHLLKQQREQEAQAQIEEDVELHDRAEERAKLARELAEQVGAVLAEAGMPEGVHVDVDSLARQYERRLSSGETARPEATVEGMSGGVPVRIDGQDGEGRQQRIELNREQIQRVAQVFGIRLDEDAANLVMSVPIIRDNQNQRG